MKKYYTNSDGGCFLFGNKDFSFKVFNNFGDCRNTVLVFEDYEEYVQYCKKEYGESRWDRAFKDIMPVNGKFNLYNYDCSDMNDKDINYKYYHSYRVMNIMELLATKLKITPKDIHLAKVIGLLHDIGRFEQDKLYNSFKDDKIDHGDYGVKVLQETLLLNKDNIEISDYEVVYKAIKNHNKFEIESNLNNRELLFSKLIRDADKIDILYALGNSQIMEILKQDNEQITKEIENDFFNHKLVNLKDIKNSNDGLVAIFCYIYDINFKESYQIIYENKYYDKIYERINNKEIFKKYIEYINQYIKERND